MRNTNISDGTLKKAAELYSTPCLCYEQSEIIHWSNTLRTALPERAELIYSVKASPNSVLLRYYRDRGFYFETASEGELVFVLNAAVKPVKIWVSGQGKTESYINKAISEGVTSFIFESMHELEIFGEALKPNHAYNCSIRINPIWVAGTSLLQTGGKSSAFGIDEENIHSVLNSKYGYLINGIFVYAGSQYFSAEDIISNTEYIFRLAERIYRDTGRKLVNLDFGGGFGVPEHDSNSELDMISLKKGLDELFAKFSDTPCFYDHTCFYFESGRYLSARTACLITSIMDIKTSRGNNYVITNGGINCLGVKQKEYRMFPPFVRHIRHNKAKAPLHEKEYIITGTTCTPIDITHPGIKLCSPSIGDYICIPDCGAYSLTFSPQNFNGFYSVPEILHSAGNFILIT